MVGRRRVLAVQPALVASQHPAVLLLGGPSTEKVNLYLPKLPDGTIIWTSPGGQTHTTFPGSRILFPDPVPTHRTGHRVGPGHPRTRPGTRDARRTHTRERNRQRSIEAERRLNDAYVAERNKPPPF